MIKQNSKIIFFFNWSRSKFLCQWIQLSLPSADLRILGKQIGRALLINSSVSNPPSPRLFRLTRYLDLHQKSRKCNIGNRFEFHVLRLIEFVPWVPAIHCLPQPRARNWTWSSARIYLQRRLHKAATKVVHMETVLRWKRRRRKIPPLPRIRTGLVVVAGVNLRTRVTSKVFTIVSHMILLIVDCDAWKRSIKFKLKTKLFSNLSVWTSRFKTQPLDQELKPTASIVK